MTQAEAIESLREMLGNRDSEHQLKCTGNIETCPNDECMVCGIRDCPHNEPLHYHHDGCPACDTLDIVDMLNNRSES